MKQLQRLLLLALCMSFSMSVCAQSEYEKSYIAYMKASGGIEEYDLSNKELMKSMIDKMITSKYKDAYDETMTEALYDFFAKNQMQFMIDVNLCRYEGIVSKEQFDELTAIYSLPENQEALRHHKVMSNFANFIKNISKHPELQEMNEVKQDTAIMEAYKFYTKILNNEWVHP